MGISRKVSPGFKKSLDSDEWEKRIEKTLDDINIVAGGNAGQIAPKDTGRLRTSKRTTLGRNRKFEWTVPYANRRYYQNNKNPQTRRWAEQDYKRNRSTYMARLAKGARP